MALYMNIHTGTVDTENGWDDFYSEYEEGNLVEVVAEN